MQVVLHPITPKRPAIQRRAAGTASTADAQATADAGVASASSRLPHFDTIQRAWLRNLIVVLVLSVIAISLIGATPKFFDFPLSRNERIAYAIAYNLATWFWIFGLIGAMIAHYTKHRTWLGAEMKAIYVRWAIYGLLFGLLPFFNVDNAAHIGGLAAGFVLGYVAGEPGPRTLEWLWRAAAVFAVLIALASFGFVWLMFPRLS